MPTERRACSVASLFMNCLEEVFSETGLPVVGVLGNSKTQRSKRDLSIEVAGVYFGPSTKVKSLIEEQIPSCPHSCLEH